MITRKVIIARSVGRFAVFRLDCVRLTTRAQLGETARCSTPSTAVSYAAPIGLAPVYEGQKASGITLTLACSMALLETIKGQLVLQPDTSESTAAPLLTFLQWPMATHGFYHGVLLTPMLIPVPRRQGGFPIRDLASYVRTSLLSPSS